MTGQEIMSNKELNLTEKVKLLIENSIEYDPREIAKKLKVIVDIMDAENDLLHIEGRTRTEFLGEGWEIFIIDKDGNDIAISNKRSPVYDECDEEGNVLIPGSCFAMDLPLSDGAGYTFAARDISSGDVIKLSIRPGRYSCVSKYKYSYACRGRFIISIDNKTITACRNTWLERLRRENTFRKNLPGDVKDHVISLRKKAMKPSDSKPLWLLQDRAEKAGDNAEALFKYLSKNRDPGIRVVFSVRQESEDFERLRQYGEVIPYESDEYLAAFLQAAKFISSQWTYESRANPTINPFRKERIYVQDLIHSDFIFLQHGITKDDLSVFGHKLKRNVKRFITAGKEEYKSIVNGNYGYSEEEVVLTGFSRYDYLEDTSSRSSEKTILLMPTWRRGIDALEEDDFKELDYYKYYAGLISDKRLLECMKAHNYRGKFVPHPIILAAVAQDVFQGNDIFSVENGNNNYSDLFGEGCLMITDYSSTAMDFAYLKKPVVYTQFDRETFFAGHTYSEGYFDYERDGFGKVCYDYESTIDEIIRCIENDCKMDDEYISRVDAFFAFTDTGNCRRIYEAIKAID